MKIKIILYILLIFWMGLIFYFSHQPSVQSDSVSNGMMEKIIDILEIVTNHRFNDNEIENIYKYGITPLRKCAHLTIYFVLGMLTYSLLKQYDFNNNELIILSILFCMLYACSDEIHQLFIYGRSGETKDVLIDTFGSFLGVFMSKNFLFYYRHKIK